MPDKPYFKKAFIICITLSLFAVLLGTLPEIWFKYHLKKNWNIEENTTTAELKNKRRYRLCLIFALDGVPYTMVRGK